jgi:tripartite-type tricarboxylate transporter receptor subunit TctC
MREASLHFVRWIVGFAVGAASMLSPITATGAGDSYPQRPIHIVLAQAPAAVVDGVTRLIADKLAIAFGVPFVVENRPGASGNIASEYVAKQAPDGYTFLVGATGMTTLPTTLGAQAIDPLRALTPVCKLITQPIVIVVHPDSHINSLAELLERARREPGALTYSTAGVGTADHLAAVVLTLRAKVEMVNVPYVNIGQEIKDLLAGEVKIGFVTVGNAQPYLGSGRLKALAVASAQRSTTLPEVPTIAESGFPGFDVTLWQGAFAPAGTPPEITERMQRELAKALTLPEVREALATRGVEPVGNSPQEFAEEIRVGLRTWPPILKAAGMARE